MSHTPLVGIITLIMVFMVHLGHSIRGGTAFLTANALGAPSSVLTAETTQDIIIIGGKKYRLIPLYE